MKPNRSRLVLVFAFALSQLTYGAEGQARRKAEDSKPKPDLADFKYGPHERNVLDLWKAKSDQPTPLVVFIHGGGFRGGSKEAQQHHEPVTLWTRFHGLPFGTL